MNPTARAARARAAMPLVALVLLALAAPWIASDQPLHVRGASRVAWERCEERLWNAISARDGEAFERARREALEAHLAPDEPLAGTLGALSPASDSGARTDAEWGEARSQLASRHPELLLAEQMIALDAHRELLDAALEPALRRLPPREPLERFARELAAFASASPLEKLAAPARAVAAEARELAAAGARRLPALSASGAWSALRSELDRWRRADASERRALAAQAASKRVVLRERSAWPVLARAHPLEAATWGALLGLSCAALLGLAVRRIAHRVPPRSIAVASACAGAALVLALRATCTEEERALDFRGEIAAARFELAQACFAPLRFGPEHARGEPAELAPCASSAAFTARGAVAPPGDPAPAPGSLARHPLGTDALGRDVLARVLHGARLSLLVGLLGALCAGAVGIALGAAAGFAGGFLDRAVRRLIEVLSCFPPLLFALALAAARGPSATAAGAVLGVVIVLVVARWTFLARLARAEILRWKEEPFVEAARALGVPAPRVLTRHLLPHALPALAVALTLEVSAAMVFESALSFLGLGVGEPNASWGGVLRGALQAPGAWWLALFPGLALLAAVLSVHRVSEALSPLRDVREEAPRVSR